MRSSGQPPLSRLFCHLATRDALQQHAKRSNYQAALWRRALQTDQLPSPVGHGWEIECDSPGEAAESGESPLVVKWMTCPAAPHALLELASCGCSTGCTSQRCRCRKSNMPCTAACRCSNCTNDDKHDTVQDESDIDAED